MEMDQLLAYALAHGDIGEDADVLKTDCHLILYLLEHCRITISPEDRFFGSVNCGGVMPKVIRQRLQPYLQQLKQDPLWEGRLARAHFGNYDFGHTSAQWESVIRLGIFGRGVVSVPDAARDSDVLIAVDRVLVAQQKVVSLPSRKAFHDDLGTPVRHDGGV